VTISTIIVHYRTPRLLEACLTSLAAATRGIKSEVIIVDNSPGLIDRQLVNHTTYIANPFNAGYAKAANQGMEAAGGEFLFFLNPDTLVHPDAVRALLHAARTVEALGCAGARLTNSHGTATSAFPFLRAVEARWWPLIQHLRPFTPSLRINRYKKICEEATEWVEIDGNLSGAALLVPHWVADKIGLFDERFTHFGQEHEWQSRMARLGLKRVFVPQAQVFHYEAASVKENPKATKLEVQKSRRLFIENIRTN
jgi:GT2 family glycosyltransferase